MCIRDRPYVDCIPTASGGFAPDAPSAERVVAFSPAATAFCTAWPTGDLRELISQILRQDPRPAYEAAASGPQQYGMKLYDVDVRWEMREEVAYVTEIVPLETVGAVNPTA